MSCCLVREHLEEAMVNSCRFPIKSEGFHEAHPVDGRKRSEMLLEKTFSVGSVVSRSHLGFCAELPLNILKHP